MYVWDRFTMSLVLMYSRPTCGRQAEGKGQRAAGGPREPRGRTRAPRADRLASGQGRARPPEDGEGTVCPRARQPRQPPPQPAAHLVEGRLPEPVFPEQQGPGGRGGQQRAVLVRLRRRQGPASLPGAQVEQKREDSSDSYHQQGEVLEARRERGQRQRSQPEPPGSGPQGCPARAPLTWNTCTSWTPSWSVTSRAASVLGEPCRCSRSQAAPYTAMLATTVKAYLAGAGEASARDPGASLAGGAFSPQTQGGPRRAPAARYLMTDTGRTTPPRQPSRPGPGHRDSRKTGDTRKPGLGIPGSRTLGLCGLEASEATAACRPRAVSSRGWGVGAEPLDHMPGLRFPF